MTNYLPGTNVTINDLGLKVAPPPAGPKVTLLGITSNSSIQIYEPFTVGSVEKAINALYFSTDGSVSGQEFTYSGTWPGELAVAIEEAVNAGAPNIEVMVIGHYSGTELINYLHPTGSMSQRFIDLSGAYDVLRNRDLDVVVPVGAYIDDIIIGNTSNNFGKQLANFCFQATKEQNSAIGVIAARPVVSWAARHVVPLTTGDGSSTRTISGEMVSLFGANISGVIPSGSFDTMLASVYFGTPSTTLVNEWHHWHAHTGEGCVTQVGAVGQYDTSHLSWLKGAADQNGNTLADVSDATATAVNTSYFTNWQAYTSEGAAATDSRGIKVDAGAYINVVAAPLRSITTQTRSLALAVGASVSSTSQNTDGAAAYAGLITSLAPQSSTTNKQIGGVTQLRPLSASQANDLTGMRYVTLYNRTKGLTVASGITGSYNVSRYIRSDFTRLTTVRIVHSVVDLIRSVADKYIGEPNNAPQMNALDAEIDQVLLSMKGQGALNSYQFAISSTPDQRVLGELDINLTLVPAFEITRINLVVSLSKEL